MKLTTLILLLACRVMGQTKQTNDAYTSFSYFSPSVQFWHHGTNEPDYWSVSNYWHFDAMFQSSPVGTNADEQLWEIGVFTFPQRSMLIAFGHDGNEIFNLHNLSEPVHTEPRWRPIPRIDFQRPTNIEMTVIYEPVVTKSTNGWVIRFKL